MSRNGDLRARLKSHAAGNSEQVLEIVAVDSGVAQNPGERPALELSMKRNDERVGLLVMLQADVTAALAHGDPSNLLKRIDELLTRDNRQPLAHTGSGNVRRTIPISSDRPSSRSPST